jgi:hypothetical protein
MCAVISCPFWAGWLKGHRAHPSLILVILLKSRNPVKTDDLPSNPLGDSRVHKIHLYGVRNDLFLVPLVQ